MSRLGPGGIDRRTCCGSSGKKSSLLRGWSSLPGEHEQALGRDNVAGLELSLPSTRSLAMSAGSSGGAGAKVSRCGRRSMSIFRWAYCLAACTLSRHSLPEFRLNRLLDGFLRDLGCTWPDQQRAGKERRIPLWHAKSSPCGWSVRRLYKRCNRQNHSSECAAHAGVYCLANQPTPDAICREMRQSAGVGSLRTLALRHMYARLCSRRIA